MGVSTRDCGSWPGPSSVFPGSVRTTRGACCIFFNTLLSGYLCTRIRSNCRRTEIFTRSNFKSTWTGHAPPPHHHHCISHFIIVLKSATNIIMTLHSIYFFSSFAITTAPFSSLRSAWRVIVHQQVGRHVINKKPFAWRQPDEGGGAHHFSMPSSLSPHHLVFSVRSTFYRKIKNTRHLLRVTRTARDSYGW